ncbi:ATP cone domain-containing protein, partial [Porphyromonas somerae]|uniref:ATP cone domain-containing protein n=1 Tax=Porphyromonas somerae TaxID=322095 RepID=UPI002A81264D
MNNPVLYIIKRDGVQEPFTPSKIENAILKAYVASGNGDNNGEVQQVTRQVLSHIDQTTISVEEVQDIVEGELMKGNSPKTGVLWQFIIVVIFAVGSCSRIRWLRFMFNLNESNCFFLFISG